MDDKYWVLDEDSTRIAAHVLDSVSKYVNHNATSPFMARIKKSHNFYYGNHFTSSYGYSSGSGISQGGEAGELRLAYVNEFRNLIRYQLVLTTSQRPAFDVRAINSDTKSLQQCKIAKSVLDSYISEKRIGRILRQTAESALVYGTGYLAITWEPSQGRPVTYKETQAGKALVYEGDVAVQFIPFGSVFSDPFVRSWSDKTWVAFYRMENKWDLIARYPKKKDEILKGSSNSHHKYSFEWMRDVNKNINEDQIYVWSFYHKSTPAVPEGKFMYFLDDEVVLYDGGSPYGDKLPVFEITPGQELTTGCGYSDAFDMIGPQEIINECFSSAYSVIHAAGIQNILNPEQSGLSAEMLSGRLRFLNYNPQFGKPESLQLGDVNPNIYQLMDMSRSEMQLISGINSVTRGQPDESLKSGVALALVESMSVRFNSSFQEAWANLLEDCGTFIIELLKQFAKTERVVGMVGRHNKHMVESFTGEDLNSVQRVIVDLGNPLARTTAGKLSIAENLLSNGIVKTAEEYLRVLETGNLEPLTEGLSAELDLVSRENDKMMDGEQVLAMSGDDHMLHISEHRCLIADPDIRANSDLTRLVMDHIMEHLQLYKSEDPLLMTIHGKPPAQQLAPQSVTPNDLQPMGDVLPTPEAIAEPPPPPSPPQAPPV